MSIPESFDVAAFVAQRLRLMQQKNPSFSLRALARVLGVSPSYLSLAVRGKRRFNATMLRRLAKLLELPKDQTGYLMAFADAAAPPIVLKKEPDPWIARAELRLLEHPHALLTGDAPYINDMSADWDFFGHKDRGLNTWVLPDCTDPERAFSARYDPDSPHYQGGAGILSVPCFELSGDWREPSVNKVARSALRFATLVTTTMRAWSVTARSAAHAVADLDEGSLDIRPWTDGYFLVSFHFLTHSDLGVADPRLPFQPDFGRVVSKIAPYHPMRTHAVTLIKCDPDSRIGVCHYTSASAYERKNGQVVTPSPYVIWKLTGLLDTLRMKPLGAHGELRFAPHPIPGQHYGKFER